MVGRVGGEEFAVVLPQTEVAQAMDVAERLCHGVEHTAIPLDYGLPLGVTISVGVTHFAGVKTNFDTLLAQADTALYEAKNLGRNRRFVFSALDRYGRHGSQNERGGQDFLSTKRFAKQEHAASDSDQRCWPTRRATRQRPGPSVRCDSKPTAEHEGDQRVVGDHPCGGPESWNDQS